MKPLHFVAVFLCAVIFAAGELAAGVALAEHFGHGPLLAGPVSTSPSFQYTCTTSATRIAPSTGDQGYLSILVWNGVAGTGPSTTPVFLGDSAVTTSGMPYCNDSTKCLSPSYSNDVRGLYCIVTSGTVTITAQTGKP